MPSDLGRSITPAQAARITGVSLLVMIVLAGFAEGYVYPRLAPSSQAEGIAQAVRANQGLLRAGILCYLLTFVGVKGPRIRPWDAP